MSILPTDLLLDGILLRSEALELGINDKALRSAVRAGALVRIRQGAYADRARWERADAVGKHTLRTAAVLRAYGSHVALSHCSAGVVYGVPLWNVSLDVVHLTHLSGGGRREAGIAHHRGGCYVDDLRRSDRGWITTPARTALDMAIEAHSVEVGVVIASDLLHRGLVAEWELDQARLRTEDRPGSLAMRAVCALSDRRLESPAEARTWFLLAHLELPTVVPQFVVSDPATGFYARVDFAIPELGLIIEVDGRQKYTDLRRPGESAEDVVLRERRRENRIREITGWEVIRLTWYDLEHPQETAARLRAIVERRRAQIRRIGRLGA